MGIKRLGNKYLSIASIYYIFNDVTLMAKYMPLSGQFEAYLPIRTYVVCTACREYRILYLPSTTIQSGLNIVWMIYVNQLSTEE